MVLLGADGKQIELVGELRGVTLSTKHFDRHTKSIVYVVKGGSHNLLSLTHTLELGLLVIVNSMRSSGFDPLIKYRDLFKGLGTMPEMFNITMKPGVKPYRLFSPRPIAAGLRDKAKAEIDKMLDLGVIEPVEQPTEWCSGLTIAPKGKDKIRVCIDLTQLNKGVMREIYPLPRVSDMLSRLVEGKIFSKIDALSGFHQTVLNPECKLLTTFVSPWGRFCSVECHLV